VAVDSPSETCPFVLAKYVAGARAELVEGFFGNRGTKAFVLPPRGTAAAVFQASLNVVRLSANIEISRTIDVRRGTMPPRRPSSIGFIVDEERWARAYVDEQGIRRCSTSGSPFVGCPCGVCRARREGERRYRNALRRRLVLRLV
jgi:hypothetical protein